MNKKICLLFTIVATTMATQAQKGQSDTQNPLLQEYKTPYTVPPFDKIKNEHYKPAITKGIEAHEAEISKIATDKSVPTFANTIEALENAGLLLNNVTTVFYNVNSANTNDEMQAIAKEISPSLSAHNDNIYLNEALFNRVKTVYDSRNKLKLGTEQSKLLEETYKSFVRSGANLSVADKGKLRQLNSRLSLLTLTYGQNVLAETNNFELIITDKKDLAGLPQNIIDAAAEAAKQKKKSGWLFTLSNASVMPFLQYAENRELRKQIWTAYQNRANNNNEYDNNKVLLEIANLRTEKAQMMGYNRYADYGLEETMAKNPESVSKLLSDLWKPALENAKNESAAIKKMMVADKISGEVQPYDWRYYTEKIRKERFDLDEQQLKQYLSIDNVQNGIFAVTEKLFGLKYKQLTNIPTFHEDITTWVVLDADGTELGILLMDFYARPSKRGGAWMTSYRKQQMKDGKRVLPIISLTCNFPAPVGDVPTLLTFDETTTFFHEFGHGLHGLLSNVNYKSLSGTSVSRDFVELPSQIMENWATDPEVLKMYARHYKTGEVMPDGLISKFQKAGTFDQGFATVEYLAAAILDMDYHTQSKPITMSAEKFEKQSLEKIGLTDAIIPRYRSTYFTHVFSGGYAAGYYSYIWAAVLDADAFDAFKKTSLFNPELAKKFRTHILEKGGTEDSMILYNKFRGKKPEVKPLLIRRGLAL
ncbi:M3 family metallopeptidase [Flavobacterium ardleyense]|uniref:M3 family metallopeptidase n=1 Tax=Flavobacterium ardleyense TaxID=2038737 RepID=UPI00298C52FB|nr:M3 family metallopeptidase [Flavobacterium ardleyense]